MTKKSTSLLKIKFLKKTFWTALIGILLSVILCAGYSLKPIELPSTQNPVIIYTNDTRDDLQMTTLQAINKAETSIYMVIYSLNDAKIIKALKKKSEEGIIVTVIYDAKASKGVASRLGRGVKKVPIKQKGLMHRKIIVIDDNHVWIGSANMTQTSLRMHNNLMIGIENPELAKFIQKSEGSKIKLTLGSQTGELWLFPEANDGPDKLKEMIRSAKKSIKVAMFTWTRNDLAYEIVKAHKRGIKATVILDRSSATSVSSKVMEILKQGGVDLRISPGDVLLHHKTMIIDDETLVTGSANWTLSAFSKNSDCFLILSPLSSEQKVKLQKMWEFLIAESKEN